MKQQIYKDLDAFLEQTGTPQAALAAKLGVSQAFISQLRRGIRTPSLPLACRISRLTRVPVESLIGERSESDNE